MRRLAQIAAMVFLLPACAGSQTTITGVSITGLTIGSGGPPRLIQSLPDAFVDAPYYVRMAAYKTSGPKSLSNLETMSSWSVTSGSLPTGLSLNGTTGDITGTPTSVADSTFTVRGVSSSGATDSQSITISVISDPTHPALPTTYLDTTYPDTTGYITVNVVASGGTATCGGAGTNYSSPQAAINCITSDGGNTSGEIISIAHGTTWTGETDLKANTMTAGKWVIITSDGTLPAEGVRAAPGDAAQLVKFETTTTTPAIGVLSSANHYRLVGLEVDTSSGTTLNYGILQIGCVGLGGNCEASVGVEPSFIYVDRCYVHGNNINANISRGVSINGVSLAVVDSYISDITNTGVDAQAIGGWNGPGPFKIHNNYLSAPGENVMFGGSCPSAGTVTMADIEVTRNYFFKPTAWYSGSPDYAGVLMDVKNIFELKNASKVYAMGNVLENNWKQAQTGYAILFKSSPSTVSCTYIYTADVNFRYNILEHSGSGYNLSAFGDVAGTTPLQYVDVSNNLNLDINSSWGGADGRTELIYNGTSTASPTSITLNHNTTINNGTDTVFGDTRGGFMNPLGYTNNVAAYGGFGVFGGGSGSGTTAFNDYCDTGWTATQDLLMRASGNPGGYPANFYFPTAWTSVFDDYANADYHIQTASPYHNAGTDGKDLGADIDAVLAATYGVN